MPAQSHEVVKRPRRAVMNHDSQVTLAVIGAALFLWLAFRVDITRLHPAPTLAGRLTQIAPELAAFAAGIACLLWVVVLVRQSQPSKAKQAASARMPAPAPRQWTTARMCLAGGYYIAALLFMGERFARFLWPFYARRISGIAGLAGLALLIADAALRWQEKKRAQQNAPVTMGVKEEGWFANDFLRGLFFFVLTIGAGFAAVVVVHRYWPTHERLILPVVVLALSVVFVYLRQNSRRSAAGSHRDTYRPVQAGAVQTASSRTPNKQFWPAIYGTGIVGLMLLPMPSQWKTGVFFAQIPLLMVYVKAVSFLKMRAYRLGHDGHTERALELERRWRWLPFYGSSLAGSILFNAGRYREAQEFIKPTAFDAEGKPRLGTPEIYTYALALGNDGRLAEAQPLLEASIPVAAKPDGFRVALATNLLEQGKDPERARALLEEAMATPIAQSTAYGQQADEAKRIARYAWALASCGRKQEIATQVQAALVHGAGLKDSDLAGIHYFAGEAWKAAGETAKARAAFQESLRLMPDGVTAIASKKGLAELVAS